MRKAGLLLTRMAIVSSTVALLSVLMGPAPAMAATAPVALPDAYATDEDTTLKVAAPGVLGNDSDTDGDPLTAVLDTATSDGTLTLNSDGSFDYDPDPDFNGSDSFTYHANDGSDDSNTATVTITVNSLNDPPVASISAIDDAAIRLPVTIKVTPQTLNLGRMGNWVKVHVHADSEDTPQQIQVTLDGSGSFDAEGDPLTYDWTLTGPDGDVVVDDDVVSQTVTLPAGDYTVTLVVNDGAADSVAASETFALTNETIADLSEADPGEFSLNGVPASELKGGASLVLSFDDDAIAATVTVGQDVIMTLLGPASGADHIDVIQHEAGDGTLGQNEATGDNAAVNASGRDNAPGQNKEPDGNASGRAKAK